jgi:predicted pyridoxine 5'-phosphate oxidase superfamily flavin-nucleotide-binding protein
MPTPSSDIAFSPAVKALQATRGSREAYARLEARGGFSTELTPDIGGFLESAVTAYLATASAAGQPYVQHRGGPPGFIRVLGERTLGFTDYRGNRQYISTGNISENDRAALIVVDYAERRRVKLWGRARFDSDPDLIARLMPRNYRAGPEQALLFDVEAWDVNCSQHIPQLLPADAVASAVQELHARIHLLEAENAKLRALVETLESGE